MSRKLLSLTLLGFLVIIFFNWSCTKLDTTNIGSDLLPEVDNIKTFADTLSITTALFGFDGPIRDSTKLSVSNVAENFAIGKIVNDPIFGKTDAELYLQLKPPFYPYYYGAPGDTLTALDSVVLCISYNGIWGDTTQLATNPIKLQVFEVDQSAHGEWDSLGTYTNPSLRPVYYRPVLNTSKPPLSDEITVNLDSVRSYRKIGKGNDSVINQIRLKITRADFLAAMADPDTLPGGLFERDTMFRAFNNGFGIKMTSGSNVLLYTHLNDDMTRLEIHYKRKNGSVRDTSVSQFYYNNGVGGISAPRRGAVASYIQRDRSSNPLPSGAEEIYLQTSPGTYASLKIPELTGYSNRIIHRAEIVMEQIPGDPLTDALYSAPQYLYLDLVDTGTTNKWKPLYYDLNPTVPYDPDFTNGTAGYFYYPSTFEVNFNYFGGMPFTKTDANGTRKAYTINVSRYVQMLVTDQTHNYEMRLFAPHNFSYPQYAYVETDQRQRTIPYVNNIGLGRIRLGGGNNNNPNYRMRLRVIYSKID